MKSVMTVAAFLLPLLGTASGQTGQEEALRTLDGFVEALNDRDFEAIAALSHYPHVRIGAGDVWVSDTARELTSSGSRRRLQRVLETTGWHLIAWESREVLQSSADKVHVGARVTSYREDGTVSGTDDLLWILTRREGRWGVQAWSSLTPRLDETRVAVVQEPPRETRAPAPAEPVAPLTPPAPDATAVSIEPVPPAPAPAAPAPAAPAPVTAPAAPAPVVTPEPAGPCAWFDWQDLMEGFAPIPEGVDVTKARRKRGTVKRPLSKISHQISGKWRVEAVIDEKGKVREARVMEEPVIEPAWPEYAEAIAKSMRRWRFEPETANGEPRPGCTTVTFKDE